MAATVIDACLKSGRRGKYTIGTHMRTRTPVAALAVGTSLIIGVASFSASAGEAFVLSDQQLDRITAGVGANVGVDMNAGGWIARTSTYTTAYSNQNKTPFGDAGVAIGLGIGNAAALGPGSSTSGSVQGSGDGDRVKVHTFGSTTNGKWASRTTGVVIVVAIKNPLLNRR
ncbi:hypothetical protein [Marinivivus vitaminiproducens]|uniref:hypothetical protein n=1 Tax=Marinivivus vitaminiproducens TaxID=3035935 RepID=UPI00279AC5F8|nr:hypothetical protein P4R82_18690 [Geminicoccaceae bacterium SCSIO 64248]